jgi:hypothetical protein
MHHFSLLFMLPTTGKSAEQTAKAVSAETQSAKKAAVTAPVPFSSEDNVQEYSAPAPAQVSAPVAAAAAPAEQFSNSDRRLLFDDSISNSDSQDFSNTFSWSDSDTYSNSHSQDFSDTFSATPQFSNSDTFSAQQWSDSDN